MAWTTPFTAVAGVVLATAQWNSGVRDNFAETEAAKATAAGRLIITTAANAIAERVPSYASVATSQTTASTTFTDLATVGPTVGPLTTGASAIYIASSFIQNSVAGQGGYMGVAVSGASTIAADVLRALRIISGTAAENAKVSYIGMFANALTGGSNTFTAKYSSIASGTVTYASRELIVIPL